MTPQRQREHTLNPVDNPFKNLHRDVWPQLSSYTVILRCKVGVLARYSETCGTRGDGEGERKRRERGREREAD